MNIPVTLTGLTADGELVPFTGFPTGVPGLVVAKSAFHRDPPRYAVVHARSGLSLGYCFTDPEAALSFAQAVGSVACWRQPGPAVHAALRTDRFKVAREPYLRARCPHGRTRGALDHDNGATL